MSSLELGYPNRGHLKCVAAILLLIAALPAQAQDKVTLRIKGEVGQKARYSSTANIALSVAGQDLKIDEETKSESTVKEVKADGSVVFTQETLSSKTAFNGETMPEEGEESAARTLTLSANGTIISYEDPDGDPEDPNDSLGIRLLHATNLRFSDNPVGAGDTWTVDLSGDDKLGTKSAKATYTLVGFEELNGRNVAKISMTYAESSGTPAMSATATHWVELESGDSIKSASTVTNVPLDLGGQSALAVAKSESSRTSGGVVKLEGQTENPDPAIEDAIAEKVKDYEKLEGLFPIYRQVKEGRESLLLEIAPDQLGKLVMLQTTASTGLADGRIAAGDPINDLIFTFEKTPNNRVIMKVPNIFFRAKEGEPIAEAVRRSFPDAIVESFTIEAESNGKLLVDISQFFRGDISMVGQTLAGGGNPLLGGGGDSMSPDRENTYVKTLKNFPTNTYVETVYNFIGRGGGNPLAALLSGSTDTKADSRSAVITLNYNMYMLPASDTYRPRMFDSRVGFFTVEYQDFTHDTAIDQKVQLITRWNLKKKDPSAAVSDVVEPIVYWIDSAVPLAYREAVKAAIESWNGPFEAAGYRNAVVAKQMDADHEFDHADMRYNVVRWITSPSEAYAIALFRTNPITGQILNTSVSVDANIVRAFSQEYSEIIRPEAMKAKAIALLKANKFYGCDLATQAQANLAFGNIAIEAMTADPNNQTQISREEYVKQFVTWVVMHEVGHTMGLRHNFVASTELSMTDLSDPEKVSKMGTSSSVMDYVAFNPAAIKSPGVRFFGDHPGRYDYWAINYGYRDIKGAMTTEDETYELKRQASETNQPGLTWLGDEFADSIDPYVTRFDLAKDPMNYWMTMGDISRNLLFKLDTFSPKPGQSFYSFTRDFNVLFNQYANSAMQMTRFIGGIRRNPNYKGDANQQVPMSQIPGQDQRRAVDQMVKMVFDEKALDFPKKYYQMFGTDPNAGLIESLLGGSNSYPMYTALSSFQSAALSALLSSSTLSNLLNQEFESSDANGTLTAREMFAKVTASVWSELDSAKPVSMLRRQLQREELDRLIEMVLDKDGTPAEAKTLAWSHLKAIRNKLTNSVQKVAHDSTKLHWEESLMRIDRALGAKPSIGSAGDGGAPSLLEQLLGGI